MIVSHDFILVILHQVPNLTVTPRHDSSSRSLLFPANEVFPSLLRRDLSINYAEPKYLGQVSRGASTSSPLDLSNIIAFFKHHP